MDELMEVTGSEIMRWTVDARYRTGFMRGLFFVILWDRDDLFVIFLILKSPGDSLGVCDFGIVEV